jgi:hypothetical protein
LKIKVASRSTTATAAPMARKKFLHRRVAWSCLPQCEQAKESVVFVGMLVTSSAQNEHLAIFNDPIMINSRWKPTCSFKSRLVAKPDVRLFAILPFRFCRLPGPSRFSGLSRVTYTAVVIAPRSNLVRNGEPGRGETALQIC